MAFIDLYTIGKIFASLLAIIISVVLWKLGPLLYRAWTSPLRRLPGPPPDSLLFGNLFAMHESADSELEHGWLKASGHVIRIPGLVQVSYSFNLALYTPSNGDLVGPLLHDFRQQVCISTMEFYLN